MELEKRVSKLEKEVAELREAAQPKESTIDTENSTVAADSESAFSQDDPGWPPAEPQAHEQPWPLCGAPHPSVHDSESDN